MPSNLITRLLLLSIGIIAVANPDTTAHLINTITYTAASAGLAALSGIARALTANLPATLVAAGLVYAAVKLHPRTAH